MEENIIYSSQNINILELLYSVILKYNTEKENIISFSFDEDDINYCSQYYLDSFNNIVQEKESKEYIDYNEFNIITNKDFNLEIYIKSKINLLNTILNKIDNTIKLSFNNKKIIISILNIDNLKSKLLKYLNIEILNNNLGYSVYRIEESILKQFENRGKEEIIISIKDLADKLIITDSYFVINFSYNSNNDIITIKTYSNVLELFLMKLYLEGYIYNFGNPIKGNIEKINNRFGNETIIKLSNNITYNKTKKIIYNKDKAISLNGESANHILTEILLDNIGTNFDAIEDIENKYKSKVNSNSDKSISEQISQTFYKLTNKNSKLKFLEEVIQGKNY